MAFPSIKSCRTGRGMNATINMIYNQCYNLREVQDCAPVWRHENWESQASEHARDAEPVVCYVVPPAATNAAQQSFNIYRKYWELVWIQKIERWAERTYIRIDRINWIQIARQYDIKKSESQSRIYLWSLRQKAVNRRPLGTREMPSTAHVLWPDYPSKLNESDGI